MKTLFVECDQCKAAAKRPSDGGALLFFKEDDADVSFSISLKAGRTDGEKVRRDFCSEECLRDFLVAALK